MFLAIILIIYATILLWRYTSFSEAKLLWQKKALLIIYSFFAVIFFGFFLFIIDIAWYFDLSVTFHALYLGMPLIAFMFYNLGKNIVIEVEESANK